MKVHRTTYTQVIHREPRSMQDLSQNQETYRLAELCAGYGGLGLGLAQAGLSLSLKWYAESDTRAAAVMGRLTTAPNLGDLTAIEDCPPVDIITAGFPCQPVSSSGQRKGIHDKRWLIKDVVAVWQRSGARWLYLENVPGLLSANEGEAFGQVLEALSEVGATAKWTHLRASTVGAPHRRNRWFCIAAYATGERQQGSEWREREMGEIDRPRPNGRTPAANTDGLEPQRRRSPQEPGGETATKSGERSQRQWPRNPTGDSSPAYADTDSLGLQVERGSRIHDLERPPCGSDVDRCCRARFGGYAEAVHQWARIIGRPPPDPTNAEGRLAPEFAEWMMGLPEGHVTAADLSRAQKLKIIGNGVVPQQAAAAYLDLTEETAR